MVVMQINLCFDLLLTINNTIKNMKCVYHSFWAGFLTRSHIEEGFVSR